MENINFNKRKVFKNDLKKSLHNNLMENNFNFIKLGQKFKTASQQVGRQSKPTQRTTRYGQIQCRYSNR